MVQGPSGSDKAQAALAYLRSRITAGHWPVNTRIPKEPELMELMGVGKSTVREAVRSLASVGMLETIRGVGTFVRSRTPVGSFLISYLAEYPPTEILVYRRALEIEAAQQAAANRSEQDLDQLRKSFDADSVTDADLPVQVERGETPGPFHHLIFAAAGNTLLSGLYTGVMGALRRARTAGHVVHGASHGLRQTDHRAILEAIAAQDIGAAAHSMALHVEHDLVLEGATIHDDPSPRAAALLSTVRNRA